jgi:hypothetical protein
MGSISRRDAVSVLKFENFEHESHTLLEGIQCQERGQGLSCWSREQTLCPRHPRTPCLWSSAWRHTA